MSQSQSMMTPRPPLRLCLSSSNPHRKPCHPSLGTMMSHSHSHFLPSQSHSRPRCLLSQTSLTRKPLRPPTDCGVVLVVQVASIEFLLFLALLCRM